MIHSKTQTSTIPNRKFPTALYVYFFLRALTLRRDIAFARERIPICQATVQFFSFLPKYIIHPPFVYVYIYIYTEEISIFLSPAANVFTRPSITLGSHCATCICAHFMVVSHDLRDRHGRGVYQFRIDRRVFVLFCV